eukprot:948739_1
MWTITLIAILFATTKAEPDCKSVEWSLYLGADEYTVTTAMPMDVCYSVTSASSSVSYYYSCSGSKPMFTIYNTANCQGSPQQTVEATQYYANAVAHCDKPKCKFVTVNTLVTTDTDCSTPDSGSITASTGVAYIDGYCNQVSSLASSEWTCDGGEASYKVYSSGDCTGDPVVKLYDTTLAYDCDDTGGVGAASVAMDFECGTASFTASDANSIYHIGKMVYVVSLFFVVCMYA